MVGQEAVQQVRCVSVLFWKTGVQFPGPMFCGSWLSSSRRSDDFFMHTRVYTHTRHSQKEENTVDLPASAGGKACLLRSHLRVSLQLVGVSGVAQVSPQHEICAASPSVPDHTSRGWEFPLAPQEWQICLWWLQKVPCHIGTFSLPIYLCIGTRVDPISWLLSQSGDALVLWFGCRHWKQFHSILHFMLHFLFCHAPFNVTFMLHPCSIYASFHVPYMFYSMLHPRSTHALSMLHPFYL